MAGTLDHNTLQLDKATNDLKALLEDVIKTKQAGTKQSYLQSLSNNGISLLLEIKHLSGFYLYICLHFIVYLDFSIIIIPYAIYNHAFTIYVRFLSRRRKSIK